MMGILVVKGLMWRQKKNSAMSVFSDTYNQKTSLKSQPAIRTPKTFLHRPYVDKYTANLLYNRNRLVGFLFV